MDSLNALVLIANFVVVPGLAYGSQLALGALGVTMVYSVLRFSNFAHGELMSFGAMITVLLTWWLQAQNISLGVLPTALIAIPYCDARDYSVGSGYGQAGLFLLSAETLRISDIFDCICWCDVHNRRLDSVYHWPSRQSICRWPALLIKSASFQENDRAE